MSEVPTNKSIVEGTLAQALGAGIAAFTVTTLASFQIYMAAGWESGFGSLMTVGFYIAFKKLRQR